MRFVDADLVEELLPPEWRDTVDAAEAYVQAKVDEARADAVAGGRSDDETAEQIRKARTKAIQRKSEVWAAAGRHIRAAANDKCWYCESDQDRSDMPVDHFRPKGRVAGCVDHGGYWWLAFEWTNYRYSCTYCNSRRVAEESDGGKQDHFPLIDEAGRAYSAEGVPAECPELLDPCDVEDVGLISFEETGKVVNRFSDEHVNGRRARTSIHLYHLNHVKAARARQRIAIRLRRKVRLIEQLDAGDTAAAGTREAIKDAKREIVKMIQSRASYCSAARTYLRGYSGIIWVDELLSRVG